MGAIPEKKETHPKRPRGWHLLPLFVDSEGTVFKRGVEYPKLKNTLPATKIIESTRSKKFKKSKFQRLREKDERDAALATNYHRKKLIVHSA